MTAWHIRIENAIDEKVCRESFSTGSLSITFRIQARLMPGQRKMAEKELSQKQRVLLSLFSASVISVFGSAKRVMGLVWVLCPRLSMTPVDSQ